MKITFLGTNGWYDTDCGNTVCTLIETKTSYLILDAGNGIYKADKYIKNGKPIYLFLSHFHLDYIEGLHTLAKFGFKSLTIIGQPGTKRTIKEFMSPKYTVPINKLPYPCSVIDVTKGWHSIPLKFECLELVHASKCFGYRFEVEGKTISYCTDTGYCKNSVILSKDADLLMSECSLLSGKTTESWPHMNPESAARLARDARAKHLALTHFDAYEYKKLSDRRSALTAARKGFIRTTIAYDGISISI